MTQPLSFSELCKNSRADTRTHVHTDIRRTRQREEGKKKKYTTAEFSDKSDQQFSLFFFSLKLQLQAFYFFELNTPRFMVKWSGDSLITRMARNCKIKVLGWVSPLFFLKLLNNTHRNKSQVSSFFFVPLPVYFSPQENNTHTHTHTETMKKKKRSTKERPFAIACTFILKVASLQYICSCVSQSGHRLPQRKNNGKRLKCETRSLDLSSVPFLFSF